MASNLKSRLKKNYEMPTKEEEHSTLVDDILKTHADETEEQKKTTDLQDSAFVDSASDIKVDLPKAPAADSPSLDDKKETLVESRESVDFVPRSYTIHTETKRLIMRKARIAHMSAKNYVDLTLCKFFEKQDRDREFASEAEYQLFESYRKTVRGDKESYNITVSPQNDKDLEYFAAFYAVNKSILFNYIFDTTT